MGHVSHSLRFTANRKAILSAIGSGKAIGDVLCNSPSEQSKTALRLPPLRGGTWMWDAVECGIQVLEGDGEAFRRVLVLITDGKTNGGFATATSATEMARRSNVLIYAAGLRGIGGRDGPLLRDLTQSTGGAYLPLDEGQDFTPAFKRIAEELHGQYILGFEARPGSTGKLRVTVSREDLTVRARKGYVVPSGKLVAETSKD